ncbi:unnamed protein product, partial [Cladocopium goreaui]
VGSNLRTSAGRDSAVCIFGGSLAESEKKEGKIYSSESFDCAPAAQKQLFEPEAAQKQLEADPKTEDSDSTEKVRNLEVMLHLIKVDVADTLDRESNLPALLTAPANHTLKPTSATVACARWITEELPDWSMQFVQTMQKDVVLQCIWISPQNVQYRSLKQALRNGFVDANQVCSAPPAKYRRLAAPAGGEPPVGGAAACAATAAVAGETVEHEGAANGMAAVVATPCDIQQHADAARALDSEIVEHDGAATANGMTAVATVFLQGWPFGHCPGFLHAVMLTYNDHKATS